MLSPQVRTLKIVFSWLGSNPDIVDGFFVDELDFLVFGEEGCKSLKDFLSGEARQGASKGFVIHEIGAVDDVEFFFGYFDEVGGIFFDMGAFSMMGWWSLF